MSVTKKKEHTEQTVDQEQQFILRLPLPAANILANDIESATNLKDKLSIELKNDHRQSTVRYCGQVYNGVMVDLPTIVECLKTTDEKSFYKTADICQMMICSQGEENIFSKENSHKKEESQEKKFLYNHGITRPLKNVRKRRFRKTMKRKYMDMPEIEKEVKLLLRKDLEAEDVKWSVELEQREQEETENIPTTQPMHDTKSQSQKDSRNLMSIATAQIFGDLSSDSNPGSPEDDRQQFDNNSMPGPSDNRMSENMIESAVAEAGLNFDQLASTSSAPFYDDESANMGFEDARRGQFIKEDLELSSEGEDVDESNLDNIVSKVQTLESTIAELKSSLSAAEEELNALDATSIDSSSPIRQQIQSNVTNLRKELEKHEKSQDKWTLKLDQCMKL